MSEVCKLVVSTSKSVVVDLNGSSSTSIKLLRAFPPGPNVMESVLVSYDSPGGLLLKAQDMWSEWRIMLRIPTQTTTANLISKVNSVRDACRSTTNALMIQREGEATPRYFDIIPTRIEPALADDLDPMYFSVQLMIPRWDFSLRTHPYDQSSSYHPVY